MRHWSDDELKERGLVRCAKCEAIVTSGNIVDNICPFCLRPVLKKTRNRSNRRANNGAGSGSGRRGGKVKQKVGDRDGWICHICLFPIPGEYRTKGPADGRLTDYHATLDHVIPKCKGGGNGLPNLKIAHMRCNQLRATGSIEDARRIIQGDRLWLAPLTRT